MKKMASLGGKGSVAKLGKPTVSLAVNSKSKAAIPAIKAAATTAIAAIKAKKSGVATINKSGAPKLGKI